MVEMTAIETALIDAVLTFEWIDYPSRGDVIKICPSCRNRAYGHAEDCLITKALLMAEAKKENHV